MSNCLLLVDLQNDYFPGGNMELVGIGEAAANAQVLLAEFRRAGSPVIHIRHVSVRDGATFFLPGSYGGEINDMVAPREAEKVVVKNFPNSFRDTGLLEILHNAKPEKVVVCGAMSHMCIDATVRAAFDFGFNCVVAEDACATRDLIHKGRKIRAADVHASFMAALAVPYAQVILTGEVIACMA